MIGYLPYGKLKWLKNVDNYDVNQISENILVRYILKVGLEYPSKLQELDNNYPLATEKLAVSYDMSNYCKKLLINMEYSW